MARPRKEPSFELTNVTGVLRRQLNGAMSATMVPISLGTLTDLLAEVDRLRSLLGEKRADAEGEPETVIPMLKPEKE
jgi:hypothetical protein